MARTAIRFALFASALSMALCAAPVYIGSRRSSLSSRARALSTLEADDPRQIAPLPFLHDSFSFIGPLQGIGFVNHTHNVVFRNDTLSLDDYTELLSSVTVQCEALPDARRACSDKPDIADGLKSGGCRPGVVITLRGLSQAPARQTLALRRHLAMSKIVVFGLEALETLPLDAAGEACQSSLFAGGSSPVFHLESSSELPDADGTLRLRLPRAGLLDAFVAAHWTHHIEADTEKALMKRGQTLSDYQHLLQDPHHRHLVARKLEKFTLLNLKANWVGEGHDGHVDRPRIPLASLAQGRVTLSCVDCHAYVYVDLDVTLGFCAHFYFRVLWWKVHLPTVGNLCIRDDRDVSAFSLHFVVRSTTQVGAGATAELAARASTSSSSFKDDSTRTRLFDIAKVPLRFSILGIPIKLDIGFGVDYRTGMWGVLDGTASTGAAAKGTFIVQYQFHSRAKDNGWTKSWESDVVVRPPSYQINSASASAYFEVLPTINILFYGIFNLNGSLAVRLQADLDRAVDDAVLCDVPWCGDGLPLYVTWQPRIVVAHGNLRLRDIISLVPVIGWVAQHLVGGNVRVIEEGEPVNKPLMSRQRLFAICIPIPRRWELGPALFWAEQGGASKMGRVLALAQPGDAGEGRRLEDRYEDLPIPLDKAGIDYSGPLSLWYRVPLDGTLTIKFTVPDSTVGVLMAYQDKEHCCHHHTLFGYCDWWSRSSLQFKFYVSNPDVSQPVYQLDRTANSYDPYVFEITPTSSLPIYRAKQAQGFLRTASSYYVVMTGSNCWEPEGNLFLAYQTLPSPTPSPTRTASRTGSNTPSTSGTGTQTPSFSTTSTNSLSPGASPSSSETATSTATASVSTSYSSTASTTASITATPTVTASTTEPPFIMPRCDRAIKESNVAALRPVSLWLYFINGGWKSVIRFASATVKSIAPANLTSAVKMAATAMLAADPASLTVAAPKGRRLGDDGDPSLDIEYSIGNVRNMTLRSDDPNDLEPDSALDVDDARYFTEAAVNGTAEILVNSVRGTLPDDMKPVADCGNITDPALLHLFCSQTTPAGRRLQTSGLVTLSFSNVFAAALVQHGVEETVAVKASSGLSVSEPVLMVAGGPVLAPSVAPTETPSAGTSTSTIVGAVVGAVAGAIILSVAILFAYRYRSRRAVARPRLTIGEPVVIGGSRQRASHATMNPLAPFKRSSVPELTMSARRGSVLEAPSKGRIAFGATPSRASLAARASNKH